MEMHAFGRLTPALVARRRLLSAVRPVGRTETVPVEQAFDRIAAAAVRAPRPVPPFPRATWDGYAIRSRDVRAASARRPVGLSVVGEVYAEGGYRRRVAHGEAVAIATGGALPPGTDAVVIFEEVARRGPTVVVDRPIAAGDRIARPGDDLARGSRLVARGERLVPASQGALAACGLPAVRVFARPIVEVVPNGNELVPPGRRLGPGGIFESNNATLSAVITAGGGVPQLAPPVRDDPTAIERALRRALARADLVISTGGSSVGERDHLPTVLPRLGRLLFHGIAVRPGKPTLAARCGDRLVIGLPGHPTSCLANMVWLVLPALRRLAHREGPGWTEEWATLGSDALAPTPGLATVVPLELRGGRAYSTFRGSASISSLARVGAFAFLPPGRPAARRGERVRICRLAAPLAADPRP